MSEDRRAIYYRKMSEGWARFAAQHPDLDFSFDSPASLQAEEELNRESVAYLADGSSLDRVREKFGEWKSAMLAREKQEALFT